MFNAPRNGAKQSVFKMSSERYFIGFTINTIEFLENVKKSRIKTKLCFSNFFKELIVSKILKMKTHHQLLLLFNYSISKQLDYNSRADQFLVHHRVKSNKISVLFNSIF